MIDEQIAQAFVQQVRNHCPDAVAVLTLTAIIGEARATERARCAAIAERYTTDTHPGPVQIAAREIRDAIADG